MTTNKVVQHIFGAVVIGIGILVLQHSIDPNFFLQWGLSFTGLMLIFTGRSIMDKIWEKDNKNV